MSRKVLPESPLAALGIGGKPKKAAKKKTAGKKAAEAGPKRPRTIHLDADLDRQLRMHAAGVDASVSDVIAAALRSYLDGKC